MLSRATSYLLLSPFIPISYLLSNASKNFDDQPDDNAADRWQFDSKDTDLQYNFGQNWVDFARQMISSDVNDVNLQTRTRLVSSQIQVDFDAVDFSGRTFLDVGSGTGLNSMAASIFLGAKAVVSVDIQDGSLLATHMLRNTVFYGLKPALSAHGMRGYVERMHRVEQMEDSERTDSDRYFAKNNHRSDGPELILPDDDPRHNDYGKEAERYEYWTSGATGNPAASLMTQKLYYQPTDDVPYPFTHMVRRNGIDEDRAFHWIICKGSILDEGFVNFLILLMEEVDKLDGVEALLPTWEERGRFYEKVRVFKIGWGYDVMNL